LRVSPIVFDLCNKKDIQTGLESKFSVYHAAAIGFVRGKGGLNEFTDEAVRDPLIKQTRERIGAISDASLPDETVIVDVEFNDGKKSQRRVDHPVGSLLRPLSDGMLEEKFRDQAAPYLTRRCIDDLIAMMWDIENIPVSAVIRTATPIRSHG
jgi:2-methylcitrate dehydratase PrpD